MIIKQNYFDVFKEGLTQTNQGCDFLVLNLKQSLVFIEELLGLLDTDNSENAFIVRDEKIYSINKTSNGEFIFGDITVSIDDVPYKIMQYKIQRSPKKREMYKMYGQIILYSTLFRLIEMKKLNYSTIQDFLEEFSANEYAKIQLSTISRYDYKIDYFYQTSKKMPTMYDVIEKTHNSKSEEFFRTFQKGDYSTGRTIGNSKGSGIKLRLYDKLIDTKDKGKFHMFEDYLTYESVLRLEGEFHSRFNRSDNETAFTFNDLNIMEHKAKVFLGIIEDAEMKKFLFHYDYKATSFDDIKDKIPYINRCISMLTTISKAGYNPYLLFTQKSGMDNFGDKINNRLKLNGDYIKEFLPTDIDKDVINGEGN